ncbi:GLPGLI family protein [Emticicia sp. CRIBPO]|uniref:GLPGLI family protein n=1 Tax=Emticicia sp. CRIBPO TaxID=2683258 RepID=UPI0014123231|nr:GLPGLI family protein [Emticicia sp. CRIBPO]NBA85400.1 GLPGLI family protein [Emticicia sp. CRIBPO]
MKKYFLIVLSLLFLNVTKSNAQEVFGTVDYDYTSDWVKIYNRATYLTKEEKEREAMTSRNWTPNAEKMKLFFDGTGSYYTYESQDAGSPGGYSWQKADYFITRDFTTNMLTEIHNVQGRTFTVVDSIRAPKWKVLNELKDIGGYMCMKATTYDDVKKQNVTAWFCADIPVSIGPEQYTGLPGLILEISVDDDAVLITAKRIDLKVKPEIPKLSAKKLKGKKSKMADFNNFITQHLKDSAYKHEFAWGLRY